MTPWPRWTRRGRSSRRASPWNSTPRWPTAGKRLTPSPETLHGRRSIAKATDPKQLDEGFYFELGATCERKGDYAEAEKYFEKCLHLAPDFAEAMNYLGYMWAEHGMKLDQAREMIEKALKAEPKNAAYLDSMAWVLFKLNQPEGGAALRAQGGRTVRAAGRHCPRPCRRHLRRAEAAGQSARGLAQVAFHRAQRGRSARSSSRRPQMRGRRPG